VTTRDASALYARAGFTPPPEIAAPKLSKMRNVRKEAFGITFASCLEAKAYTILRLWQMSGAIRDLELQPAFVLQGDFRQEGKAVRAIRYLADFKFFDVAQGRVRYVDTKGIETPMFKLKRKMMRLHFPDVDLEIWNAQKVKELARC
jgi:hypothetical protein